MKEVAPGVFVESAYPPYNVVLIKTSAGGLVVDLPPNPVDALNWMEQARAMAMPLRYVILTNAQRDRHMATVTCNIPIIASVTTLRAMEHYAEERNRREFAEVLTTQYPEAVSVLEQLVPQKPAIAFDDSFTFHTDKRVLHFETVAGSAIGSLWIYIPDQELLIAGDTVVDENTVPALAQTPDSKAWLNTMGALAHRHTVRWIVPGRGKPIISNGDIEPQREFMRVMRRAARTLARKGTNGLSLSQTAQELGQTFFNRQGQNAVKEIRAGLEHLIRELQSEDISKNDNE